MDCRKKYSNNDLLETVKKFYKYVSEPISNANGTVITALWQGTTL